VDTYLTHVLAALSEAPGVLEVEIDRQGAWRPAGLSTCPFISIATPAHEARAALAAAAAAAAAAGGGSSSAAAAAAAHGLVARKRELGAAGGGGGGGGGSSSGDEDEHAEMR
jgi:hypothetical protein